MEWYYVSILLSITYIVYIIVSEYLDNYYNIDPLTILVNTLIVATLCCLIFYPNKVYFSFDFKYLLIFIIGLSLFFQNYFLQYGISMKFNMGLIDGLAIAIYLPLLTILLHILFKEKITLKKFIGIFFVSFGSYFILS